MANCFEENRNKVCHACDSPLYKKINTCCEQSFYRIGVLTAIYAPAILVFFVVFFGGLGLGIFQANFQNDIYYLWIEHGSRLLGERAYTEAHLSAGQDRQELQVFTSSDYTSNSLTRAHLPFVYDTLQASLATTAIDEDLGNITWKDVCERIPAPAQAMALMRAVGGRGFPCEKYSPTDCFSEGGFAFDMPDAYLPLASGAFPYVSTNSLGLPAGCCATNGGYNLTKMYTKTAVTAAPNYLAANVAACESICNNDKLCVAFDITTVGGTCNFYTGYPSQTPGTLRANGNLAICPVATQCYQRLGLWDKYLFQQSYKPLTDAQIIAIAGTSGSCTNWAGVQLAQDFNYGGVTRNAKNVATSIASLEIVILLKSANNFAISKCVDKCVATKGCTQATQYAMGVSCPAAGLASFPNAIGNCSSIDAVSNQYVGVNSAGLGACAAIYATCFVAAGCNPATNPKCGACAISQTSPTCLSCFAPPATCNPANIPLLNMCAQAFATATGTACVYNAIGAATVCEIGCQASCQTPSAQDVNVATTTLLQWEQNFINYLETAVTNSSNPFTLDYFTERSTDDLVNAAGAADGVLIVVGYIVMIIWGCVTLFQMDTLQSRLMLGFVGMFLVILSIVASLGFTAIVGIAFVPTIVQVLPFLALGLGTYDMFILAFGFTYYPEKTIPAMIGELMKECGPRLLLTACTNIIVFGIGANIPLAAVYWLSASMCIVILFNFLILVFGFGAVIALNADRIRRNKTDCICCMNARYKSNSISTEKVERIGKFPTEYARLMFTKPMQVFVLATSIIVFAIGMWGIGLAEIGLPLADIVPKDNYAYGFLKVHSTLYPSGSSDLVFGYRDGQTAKIDYTNPTFIRDALNLEVAIQNLHGTDPTFPLQLSSWLDSFLLFCLQTPGCPKTKDPNDPFAVFHAVSLSTGAVTAYNSTAYNFFPNKTLFPSMLQAFLSGSTGLTSGKYLELDSNFNILSSRISFYQAGLYTDQDIVNYILATRAITDACPQLVYPSGLFYDLYEQYVHVKSYLGSNLGYTCIGVLLITSVFLLHPGATLIMFTMIVITIAEIYGFLSFFGLKINGVSVVNMVMAIGVVVVPVAHITRVFMVSHGTTAARAEHSLAMMTFPMLFSTISTFLGEFPLEFARFPYFRLYFFYQYVIIGILTLFNSFFPLPLLLAYFGPPPFAEGSEKHTEKGKDYEKGQLTEIPGLEESTNAGTTDTSRHY